MRLKCKRAHMPWPGIRIPHGYELVLGPENDELAEALIKRGFFDEDKDDVVNPMDVEVEPEKAEVLPELPLDEPPKEPEKRHKKGSK